MRRWPLVIAVGIELVACGTTLAADPRFPDWPCIQVKVPELSVAAVWAGPAIDEVGSAWTEDASIRDLVPRLAARRTPLEQAQTAIADFVAGAPAERQHKARLLFAGLFTTLNNERSEVMRGIERYTRRQREFAEQVRALISQLHELQDKADRDQAQIDELTSRVEWQTRIFDERRRTIGYVCEVPVLIEQRLFGLARAIQEVLE